MLIFRPISPAMSFALGFYQDRRFSLAISAGIILCLALALLAIGPSHIMAPWDVLTLLDGGWRIFEGQTPHSEHYNPIGILTYSLIAVGMLFGKVSLGSIVIGNTVFLIVLGVLCLYISFCRLSPLEGVLFVLFIALLLSAPRPLGYDPYITTYAMIYNRYGWVLLSMLSVLLYLPQLRKEKPYFALDASWIGLLLGLLLYCKISFFIVGFGGWILSLIGVRAIRHWGFVTLGALGLVCLCVKYILGVTLHDYFHDIGTAAKAQSFSGRLHFLRYSIGQNLGNVLALGFAGVYAIGIPLIKKRISWPDFAWVVLIFSYNIVMPFFITMGNATERSDIPLFWIAVLIMLTQTDAKTVISSRFRNSSYAEWIATVIIFVIFAGNIIARDASSLVRSAYRSSKEGAFPSVQFNSDHLRDFKIPITSEWHTAYTLAKFIPHVINDGLDLLKENKMESSKIIALGYSNPFSFALGTLPAKGFPVWFDLNYNFSETSYPAPDIVFAEADAVMIPIISSQYTSQGQATLDAQWILYKQTLNRDFRESARSEHWILLKRFR